jgi:hypothetical protein
MSRLSSTGEPLDEHAAKIRARRHEHEVYSMKGSLGKYEIDIMEHEAGIERNREQIASMTQAIEVKEAKFAEEQKARQRSTTGE